MGLARRWRHPARLPGASPDHPEDVVATAMTPDDFLQESPAGDMGWLEPWAECRPGAYWWWPAAVTRRITWNLETYRKAGWGNMGVIGIYGVRGEEERFIDIFSPKWFEMFNHAVAEAKRLGMNIDLTPSSGWRMGGPHVTPDTNRRLRSRRAHGSGQRRAVKRAGPGGWGLAVNPYSRLRRHLD
jgi:hypothetical protein